MKPKGTVNVLAVAATLLILIVFIGTVSAAEVAPEHFTNIEIKASDGGWTVIDKQVSGGYYIDNEANWRYVVNDINTNVNSIYRSANLVLTRDIVFTSRSDSLGNTETNAFTGAIYGNGHKFINFTQYGSAAHGLIYYANDGCLLNYIQMTDSNIESGSGNDVGSIIGHVRAASDTGVRLEHCSVNFTSITPGCGSVGGLVGCVISAKVWINASAVNRVYMHANGDNIGGIIGYTDSASTVFISDSRVEDTEGNGNNNVGGIIGCPIDSSSMSNTTVKNCKILAGGAAVGGFIGSVAENSGCKTFDGCRVENCTITGYRSVGGAIGQLYAGTTFIGRMSWVNDTWVWGNQNYGALCGYYYSYGGYMSGGNLSRTTVNGPNPYWGFKPPTIFVSWDNCFSANSQEGVGANIGVAGTDYGYRGYYIVTVVSSLNGTCVASPEHGPTNTLISISGTPNPGYHFNASGKWNVSGVMQNEDSVILTQNIIVAPNYEANTTTVTFHNETETEDKLNTFGQATRISATPQKTGFAFVGWNVSLDSGLWADFNSDAYNKNGVWNYSGKNGGRLDVYANWSAIIYSIENASSDPKKGTALVNKTTAKYLEPVKATASANSGYHFVNWACVNVTPSSQTENPYVFQMPAMNVGLTANFASNSSTVIYQSETGKTYDMKTYSFNAAASLPSADPEKEGYTFNGWNITVGGQEYPFSNNESYIKDNKWVFPGADNGVLTVNASWLLIEYPIEYDLDSGTATNPSSYNITTPTITLTDAAKPGYNFEGWYNNTAKSAQYKNSTIPLGSTGSRHFWANFLANTTTVVFHMGNSAESKLNAYNQAANIAPTPRKTGYTFSHWNVSSTGLPLTDSMYVKDGVWNYTGVNDGTLHVYANWTESMLTLSVGWNVISVPKAMDSAYDTAAELFTDVNTTGRAVLTYNAQTKNWEQVTASTKITPLNAYWIYSADAKTLPYKFSTTVSSPAAKNVYTGWNAVGLSADDPMSAAETFGNTNWYTYLEWNSPAQQYNTPLIKGGSGEYADTNPVSLWTGGWLYVNADGTYMGFTA